MQRIIRDRVFYDYSYHSTRDRAEASLEDSFATGEILLAEHPKILKISPRCYAVALYDANASNALAAAEGR